MRKIARQGSRSIYKSKPLTALKNMYAGYKARAKRDGHSWRISLAVFVGLVERDCVYCGRKPSNTTSVGKYKYQGVDRVNSKKGYCLGNVVPCCKQCNSVKSNILSGEEMMLAMQIIKDFRKYRLR